MNIAAPLCMVSLFLVAACNTSQSGRMGAYLGAELSQMAAPSGRPVRLPAEGFRAGLLVINDTTGPDSAPPLSAPRRALMENVVRESLERSLPIQVVAMLPASQISGVMGPARLRELGWMFEIEYMVLALLSSQDAEEPTHLGQSYMMTQMPGVTFVNRAVMEIALLDVKGGTLLAYAAGRGTEMLDELDVPLGRDLPSKSDTRDIVRVNAGKHALDRATADFTEQIDRIYVH